MFLDAEGSSEARVQFLSKFQAADHKLNYSSRQSTRRHKTKAVTHLGSLDGSESLTYLINYLDGTIAAHTCQNVAIIGDLNQHLVMRAFTELTVVQGLAKWAKTRWEENNRRMLSSNQLDPKHWWNLVKENQDVTSNERLPALRKPSEDLDVTSQEKADILA
ncbi:hypothetical protein E2C01_000789 [Portunus trituberculatus]|uniref:Uncharacterized protein n=1 Tax=Portunus trituberculatus TaxID=210409 RepID=A0A5B7CF29_PORTR|nr:hypothetical protein [Portunus trituberculatus]